MKAKVEKKKKGNLNTATINRKDFSKGNYATICRKTLFDERLTESSLRLLICLLNNAPGYVPNLTYYGNKFGWSNNKLSSSSQLLEECGYLKKTKNNLGAKGFSYHYDIFEIPIESTHPVSLISGATVTGATVTGATVTVHTDSHITVRELNNNNLNNTNTNNINRNNNKGKEMKMNDVFSNCIIQEGKSDVEADETLQLKAICELKEAPASTSFFSIEGKEELNGGDLRDYSHRNKGEGRKEEIVAPAQKKEASIAVLDVDATEENIVDEWDEEMYLAQQANQIENESITFHQELSMESEEEMDQTDRFIFQSREKEEANLKGKWNEVEYRQSNEELTSASSHLFEIEEMAKQNKLVLHSMVKEKPDHSIQENSFKQTNQNDNKTRTNKNNQSTSVLNQGMEEKENADVATTAVVEDLRDVSEMQCPSIKKDNISPECPSVAYLKGKEITTEEEKHDLLNFIGHKFQDRVSEFKNREDMVLEFRGFFKSIRLKGYRNYQGQIVDDWQFFTTNIINSILKNGKSFKGSNRSTLKQETKQESTNKAYAGLYYSFIEKIEKKISFLYNGKHWEGVNNANNVARSLVSKLGIEKANNLFDNVVANLEVNQWLVPLDLFDALNSNYEDIVPAISRPASASFNANRKQTTPSSYELHDLAVWVSDYVTEEYQKKAFEEVGGIEKVISPIVMQFGFDEAYKLICEVLNNYDHVKPTHFEQAAMSKLSQQFKTPESLGKRYC